MLIPRFSVRWLLALMACCALLAFLVSLAVAGATWAMAVSLAVGNLALLFMLHAAAFSLAWCIAATWRFMTSRQVPASPFAIHQAPPQILKPQEPD